MPRRKDSRVTWVAAPEQHCNQEQSQTPLHCNFTSDLSASKPVQPAQPFSALHLLCCQVPLTAVLLLFELTQDYFIIVPTLAAVGISYWTASLPIAAGISARLQAAATAEVGAGSVASVDGDDIVLGPPLLPQIKIPGFAAGRRRGKGGEQAR